MVAATNYCALVNAARSLVNAEFLAQDDPAVIQIRTYLSDNEASLHRVREILREPCAVPLRFEADFFDEHIGDFPPLRALAKTLALAARQSAADERFAATARWGLDLLALAGATRRGGLIVDFQYSTMIGGIAVNMLRQHRSAFGDADRRPLIRGIVEAESDLEPLDSIIARDRRWEVESGYEDEPMLPSETLSAEAAEEDDGDVQQAAWLQVLEELSALPDDQIHALHREGDLRQVALRRLLTVDLALRCHRERVGRYPRELAAISGDCLPDIPADPCTGGEFRYRPSGQDSFQLYSPGPTGIDHGGQIGHWLQVLSGEADLGLDSFDYGPGCTV